MCLRKIVGEAEDPAGAREKQKAGLLETGHTKCTNAEEAGAWGIA